MGKLKARHFRFEPRKNFAVRARDGVAAWSAATRDRFGQLFSPNKARSGKNAPVAPASRAKAAAGGTGKKSFPADDAAISNLSGGFSDSDGGGALGALIRSSADAIASRQSDLAADARRLAGEIQGRRDGSVTMIAWAIRFLVALCWGAIAMQLVLAALGNALLPHIYGIGPVNAGDLRALARIFGAAAFFGVLAVVFGAGIVHVAGRADNTRVRRIASNFGDKAADLALQFDDHLNKLRQAMNERSRPVDAVSDLSRAHLTALEAAVFFRGVQFLTSDSDAPLLFRGYLARSGGITLPSADPLTFMAGIIVGAFSFFVAMGMPEVNIPLPDFENIDYDAVEYWILLGGLIYVMAGMFAEIAAGFLGSPFTAQAREEALEAARSGFVARQAPRVEDVIRRIEDAIDVYTERVDPSSGGAKQHAAGSQNSLAPADDTPAWRKTPEGPRFVDTGFQAAPKTFRTDAFAKTFSKKSRPSAARGSAAKRGFLGLKKPPGA